jgi:hypothetical protein
VVDGHFSSSGEPLNKDSCGDMQPLECYLRQPIGNGVLPTGDVLQLDVIEMALKFSNFIYVCPHGHICGQS